MRKLYLLILLLVNIFSYSQSQDQNYIVTKYYKTPTSNSIENPSIDQANTIIKYFDNNNKQIQEILFAQGPSNNDIIVNYEYDAFGRKIKSYLPYSDINSSLNYREYASQSTINFYNEYANDSFPFSEKIFDVYPVNKTFEVSSPGEPWKLGSNHTTKYHYSTNSLQDNVINLKVFLDNTYTPSYSNLGYYPAYTLYKYIVFDENTNKTELFYTLEGKLILKRNFNNNEIINTYYVYDDFGNLTLIIPPNVNLSNTTILNSDILNQLCYQYIYNGKNLLINRKLPGKGMETNYYDEYDRLKASYVLYAPNGGVARSYIYYFYDQYGRIIQTGHKYGNSYVQNISINNLNKLSENFYDDYPVSFNINLPNTILGQNVNPNVKGLITGNLNAVIDDDFVSNNVSLSNIKYNKNIVLYDDKYNIIAQYTFYPNGGYIKYENLFDFSGKIIETHTYHKENLNSLEIHIKENFTYSPQDYLVRHTHQINDRAIENINVIEYDPLGKILNKKIGGNSTALQAVDYKYNIRGWLTDINNIDQPQDKLFNYRLKYNELDVTDINNDAVPTFNGNISASQWSTVLDNSLKNYTYKYDNLNRLIEAKYFNQINDSENFDEIIKYDKIGNITKLVRFGRLNPLSNDFDKIDDLQYIYNNSNRLIKVEDSTLNAEGFNQNGITTSMFTYNNDGALLQDKTKEILNITYNHLSLPILITFENGGKIEYIYTADGVKLYKKVYQDTAQPPVVTTYRNGFQYVDGVLKFFPHAEGYVNIAENGNFEYIYNYKDHLGNIRLSYKYDEDATQTDNITIVDASDYYPFGLKHKGSNSPNENSLYKYKFNGHEFQDELNLNLYDYNARNYDPALGRFLAIDPLADFFSEWTPYHYVHNNPTNLIDPTGMYMEYPDDGDTHDDFYNDPDPDKDSVLDGSTVLEEVIVKTTSIKSSKANGIAESFLESELCPDLNGQSSYENNTNTVSDGNVIVKWLKNLQKNASAWAKRQSDATTEYSKNFHEGIKDTKEELIEELKVYYTAHAYIGSLGTAGLARSAPRKIAETAAKGGNTIITRSVGAANKGFSTVLQSGGHTLNNSTLKALGLTKEQGKIAIEALKNDLRLPANFHGKIMGNGDLVHPHTREVLGNLFDYLH